MTSFYQKFPDEKTKRPDFWILYSVVEDSDCPSGLAERFFILSHAEMAKAQAKRNSPKKTLTYAEAAAQYPKGKGVDNVLIEHVQKYENQWDKVIAFCKQ